MEHRKFREPTTWLMILTIFVLVIMASWFRRRHYQNLETSKPSKGSLGIALRKAMLSKPVSELGFSPDSEFPNVYGILTDWNLDGPIASIVAIRDGTTSLYTTSDYVIVGGHGHERVLQAASRYLSEAQKYSASSEAVTEFPYPQTGKVFYYLLTYDGVRLCIGDEAGIDRRSDPTWPLFTAAQNVLTELRFVAEEQRRSGELNGGITKH